MLCVCTAKQKKYMLTWNSGSFRFLSFAFKGTQVLLFFLGGAGVILDCNLVATVRDIQCDVLMLLDDWGRV